MDENTSEGDQSLDKCLLHTTAYRSPWKQHSATNTGARLRNIHLTTTDCTPSLLRACANAPNQPHPSPPAHPPPLRFDQTFRHVKNVTENRVYYGASQVLYGKSITSSGPIRLCDSNELCTKVSWVLPYFLSKIEMSDDSVYESSILSLPSILG